MKSRKNNKKLNTFSLQLIIIWTDRENNSEVGKYKRFTSCWI